jgi:catalase
VAEASGTVRIASQNLLSRDSPGVKGYDGIVNFRFNGTHNGMAPQKHHTANGMKNMLSVPDNNGAPRMGTHTNVSHKATNGTNGHINGHANGNDIAAH